MYTVTVSYKHSKEAHMQFAQSSIILNVLLNSYYCYVNVQVWVLVQIHQIITTG